MSYIDNIVKFHTFSKSTVRENLTLGEAVNPSGHTVTAKQIRTQDIPAFIYSFQTSETDALTWAAGNIDAHVRHNDILYWGSQFNMGFEMPNCLIRVAKLEDENGKVIGELPSGTEPYWEPFALSDKTVLRNSVGDPVITIHKGCKISYVHGDNNAAVNSNKFAAFVKTNDGRLLDHFISPTDQIIGGQPSLGYNLLLFKDGQGKALTEGEEIGKDNYIANAYAGIIHFMDERTETHDASKNYEVNGFNVYCYEYTGNKLDSMLTESTAELKDYVDNEINKAIEYRTVNITKGTDNIEIEYKDTTDGDGNPGTYTISVDGYTTSEIDAIKDDINGALDDHIDDSTIHVTGNDKSRWDKAEGLLDEHIIDSTMHVTSNDKLRWNEAEELLVEHINDDNKHVTEGDRERWDKGGSAIQSISAGDYIDISETNTISVTNVTSNIAESADSYLTTAASVREYVKDINDNNTISDIIWNLNDLLVSCINDTDGDGVKWVQELLRANVQDNREINEKLIGIVNYQDIYGTNSFEEATEMWINEASDANKKISTQLSFLYDSYITNDLFRLLFYNLDVKLNNVYGASGSVSAKYMKPGLTIKYLANVEDNIENYPNEGFGKKRYKYITVRYRGKTQSESSISEDHIDWTHTPSIDFIITRPSKHPDTFRKAKAWDVIDSEEYDNSAIIKANIEALDERVTIIEGSVVLNTLTIQPSETVQWNAIEFKEPGTINNINTINKKIRGISIKVANTVSTPQFLAVFDTRTPGIKKLLGVSEGTTWNANETAIFKFNSPFIIPGIFEIFLLDEPISTDLSGDPTKKLNYYVESYALSGEQCKQSYRNKDGNWDNPKRLFCLTFNFVEDRISAVEEHIKPKVEALPSVYTGNNEIYVNCYGFEYISPSENIIFDKIEIKFAKNLDTLKEFRASGAPEIIPGEVENNICKITVAKVVPPDPFDTPSAEGEIEIATSNYNIESKEVNLSQFNFSKNILLEKGWNYRFYFYDKNDNLFAAPVIINTVPDRDTLLPRQSVASRYLSERYDYWGAYNWFNDKLIPNTNIVLNGLAVKLINSVQEHINDDSKHITEEDRERWDKGGSAIQSITHDDFINAVGDGNIWDLSLNVASDITKDNQNLNDIKSSTVPTTAAVIDRISDDIQYHVQMFAGHMPFEDQRHSMAGGDLRTLISEKIEPSNLYTFDRQPGGSQKYHRLSKIYLANKNAAFNGFIKEITFTNSSCDYNGDIYVKINENYPINKYNSAFGRCIGVFRFNESREGGLKVEFSNDFKVDSEHDYYFTFYNTSEIDENSEDGNISLNLLATNDMGSNTPMFTGSGFRSWNTFSSKNRSNRLYYSNF